MRQILTIGGYLVEVDGSDLTFRDANGQVLFEQGLAGATEIHLPNGETLPLEALTERMSPEGLAEFQTAAGSEPPAGQEIDDGSGNFAAFDPLDGLGGLDAVGGLDPTQLQYGLIEREAEVYRSDEEHDHDASSLIPMPQPLPPHVVATDGHIDFNITNTSGQQNPFGDLTVGDYLSTGGGPQDSIPVDPSMVNGVDNRNLTMAEAAEVKVSFVSEYAGCHSLVGFYTYDDAGNVIPGSLQFLWLDGSQVTEGTPGSALAQDFLGNTQPQSVSLGTLDAGTHFGFFIVADNPASNTNHNIINSVAGISAGSDDYASDLAAINAATTFAVDADGNGQVLVNGQPLSGGIFFTHDPTLNNDGIDSDIEHAISGVTTVQDGQLYVGFEDLMSSNPWFDSDYNDLVISVDMGPYNLTRITQNTIQPTVDFTDQDGTDLTQVVIATSGFTAEDSLQYLNDARFSVTSQTIGNDVILTITALAGSESLQAFEDYVNAIYFATSGMTEGDRHISYQVTDTDGLSSNVADIDVAVTVTTNPIMVTNESGDDHAVLLSTHHAGEYNGEDQDVSWANDDHDQQHTDHGGDNGDHVSAISLSEVLNGDDDGNNLDFSDHNGDRHAGHEPDHNDGHVADYAAGDATATDQATDYGSDTGTDTGVDAGDSAGTDAGIDMGADAGAGIDFETGVSAFPVDDGMLQAIADINNLMAQTVI